MQAKPVQRDPGNYQLRASALSKKLDRGGSVFLDITVPDFSKTPLALTPIALGYADGARVPVGRTNDNAASRGGGAGSAWGMPPRSTQASLAMWWFRPVCFIPKGGR